jgi:hypothetical protein
MQNDEFDGRSTGETVMIDGKVPSMLEFWVKNNLEF